MTSPHAQQNGYNIDEIATGMISWDSKPAINQNAGSFDWSGPVHNKVKTDDLDLKWSDDEG